MTSSINNSGIILKVDASTGLEMTVDGRSADGKSTNTATAWLENDGDNIADIVFTFTITQGNAVFVANGKQTVDIKANPVMVATADFTDTTGESGEITVYPTLSNELTASTTYTFKTAEQPKLNLAVNTDNAAANNTDYDEVQATLTHNGGQAYPGQRLKFTASGGAQPLFSDDGIQKHASPFYSNTNDKGEVRLFVYDTSNEDDSFLVNAELESDPTVNSSATVHFKGVSPKPVQPVINQFYVTGNVTLGQSSDGTPCQVTAEIIPASGTPPTKCFIKFSSYGASGLIQNSVHISDIAKISGRDSGTTYIDTILVQSPKTTYTVNVHYMGPEDGSTHIKAELAYDAPDGVFATSQPDQLVNFKKATPVIDEFDITIAENNGKANDVMPGSVCGYLKLAAGSPTTSYIVKYFITAPTSIANGKCTLTEGRIYSGQSGNPSEIDVLMPDAKGGETTYTFAWVHDLESKSGYATIRAELWTVGAGARPIAYSKNNVRLDFAGTPPPPPPPPAPTLPKLRVNCRHYWADQPSYGTYTCFIDIEVVNGLYPKGNYNISSDDKILFKATHSQDIKSTENFTISSGELVTFQCSDSEWQTRTHPLVIKYENTVVWSGTFNTGTTAVTGN